MESTEQREIRDKEVNKEKRVLDTRDKREREVLLVWMETREIKDKRETEVLVSLE